MYKIGDKVETPFGVGKVLNINGLIGTFEQQATLSTFEFPIGDVKPYRTAHEKLIELGWENKLYERDTRRYEAYNMWVIFDVTNKTYTINKLVGIAIICPNIDIALSRILTQYLEELEE